MAKELEPLPDEMENEEENQQSFEVNEILSEEQKKEFLDYFEEELREAESEREPYLKKVDKWRRQREATPEQERKSFPWDGASNVVSPFTKSCTNSIVASMKGSFAGKKPFFSLQSHEDSKIEMAKTLTDYLSVLVESKFHLNLREIMDPICFDLVSLGTEFVHVPWVEDVMKFKRKGASGTIETVSVTRKKGPAVIPIRIEDFYTRDYVTDIQNAPWIARKHRLTWHELKQREDQGFYVDVDKIKDEYKTDYDENLEEQARRQEFDPGAMKIYEIYEVYRFMDVDNDDVPEDIICYIEKDSGTFLRVELNDLGVRPFVRIPYIAQPHRLYGEGVGRMLEHIQDGIDALLNMAINSTHLSSLQMFATRRNSGIGPNEEFRPLKQFEVDNPRDDIFPIVFPNTAAPNMQMINMLTQWGKEAVGSPNAMMGQSDPYAKTRATASGTMFLAQQSSRLFSAVVENVEEAFAQIGALVLFQLVRNRDRADLSLLGEEKIPVLRQALSMNVEDVHLNFKFSITTSKVEQTEEAQRQRILTLSQLYNMYGQQYLGLVMNAMQVGQQFAPQLAQQFGQKYFEAVQTFMVGSGKIMDHVLEFFNLDRNGLLPYTKDIEMMMEAMTMMKDQQLGGMMNGQPNLRQVGGENQAGSEAPASASGPVGEQGNAGGGGNTAPQPQGGTDQAVQVF